MERWEGAARLPERNADGLPPVAWTEEQKYLFDTRGWLLVPGVLPEAEVSEMRAYCYRLQREPESLPPAERSTVAGPLQRLADHPLVLWFMNEFVAYPPLATAEGYGFRLENSFLVLRRAGEGRFQPHNGSGFFNFPGDSHVYCCRPGVANSGLTRVVWELNPVEHRGGGTMFLSGSHKAAFPRPASTQDPESPLWETYACPAGSAIFFSEATTHTTAPWKNQEWDRVAVFSCYNTVNSKWHDWEPHPELLARMPPLRRSLFRGVYAQRNAVGGQYG
jgi:hypothetical protein